MITRRELFTPVATRTFAALAAAVPGRASAGAPDGGRRRFSNVSLLTQDNQSVRFYDDLVKGKIVMFNFFYVSCTGTCPASTANLVKVQHLLGNRVGRDIFMYSISLKPREDRPAQLKEYEEMHGIKAGWTLREGAALKGAGLGPPAASSTTVGPPEPPRWALFASSPRQP